MKDLTLTEQKYVRTVLFHLRRTMGGWKAVAKALGFQYDTVEKTANARGRGVSGSMAIRVARLVGVAFDDLISGRYLPGACPRCGYTPDFADQPTIVENGPRDGSPSSALKLVRE